MSFLFAAERFCLALSWRVARTFPVLFVNSLLTWGYCSLVWSVCLVDYSPGVFRNSTILLATLIYGVCTFTYLQVLYLGPGSPLDIPGFAHMGVDGVELDEITAPPDVLNNVTAKDNGEMRYCSKCLCWKPDRTHHCRSCRRCILRMDHHCPWFGSCVGFRNQKAFNLFLLYTVGFCAMIFAHSFSSLYRFLADDAKLYEEDNLSVNVVLLAIVSGIMTIVLIIFTSYCFYNLLHNQTTLEAMEHVRYKTAIPASQYRYNEAPSSQITGNLFDLGTRGNLCSVMGDSPYMWFIPIPNTPGHGTSFPINQKVWQDIQQIAHKETAAMEQYRQWDDNEASRLNSARAYDRDQGV